MLIGNLYKLPLLDRLRPPANQAEPQEPASPPNETTQPEPTDDQMIGPGGNASPSAPAAGTSPGASSQTTAMNDQYRLSSMHLVPEEPTDVVSIEAWARRAALEVQKHEQFASMLQRISKPEAAAQVALLQNESETRSDLRSVTAAYGENQDPLSAANSNSEH
ncbi:hypothetical protein ACFPOD_10350 [Nitratireductor kimnyeongensis]|uniref:Uncharacterized protein n=1 Tax=Nitratireductor kimnyeongensis TaxID=430679 RepID=A0ABW0TAI2_9HYPH|nr:hypothetical protein [Nitratireductor kimnyeongensis]QZZ36028.1 hypothetical protein KW403_02420 [Nitratireductor kimnyeongensis]